MAGDNFNGINFRQFLKKVMKKKPNRIMLKIFKVQLWITTVFFFAYIISIVIGGEGSFLADMHNKKRVAGTAVSATLRIFGPPEKPVVMGNTVCNDEGFSAVNLNWASIVDATSYNVYRNGEPVAVDLADNFFTDGSVTNNSNYTYYVIAEGPAGEAVSDEGVFLTKNCTQAEENFITISSFDGKNTNELLVTNNKKPLFQGQTNIPFATVELEIRSDLVIYATTQTNANGYWQWSPPVNIPYGSHTLYIKVTDPSDVAHTVSISLAFEIVKEVSEGDEDKDGGKESEKVKIYSPVQNVTNQSLQKDGASKPFELGISLENEAHIKGVSVAGEAYRGENLKTSIEFDSITGTNNISIDINYELIDPAGDTVAQYLQQVVLKEELRVEKIIPLPQNLKLGRYKLKISATIDNITVNNESMFILKDKPLLKIGASTYITYPGLISNLSWLSIASTVFLAFFSALALWEHHLYKKSFFHITERVLKRKGFIN